ncbi:hypothetical protein RUM44_005146 [Polyplax serrata]|uniref:Carbonic anhydrase n=1 Tax=Polyplax serrata TaxID=468196 RepID=A0ABR1AE84_POLSC
MVLPEFSFCVLSSLVLSKVNLFFVVLWESVGQLTNWTVEFPVQWMLNLLSYCLLGDMLSWLETKTKICEIVLVGLLLIILGPSVWKEHYENAKGEKQSPINILISEAVRCPCGPLEWNYFSDLPASMVMHNDGYSGEVAGSKSSEECSPKFPMIDTHCFTVTIYSKWSCGTPTLTGGPLNHENYVFNRLYFHWGPTDTEGSEHTLDYERFPLELHVVFLKDCYNNLMEAHYDNCYNGIVIVVFLFEITPVDNPGFLNIITDNLHNVKHPKSRCHIQPFSLSDIYPEFQHGYYKYEGSITQPPCSEIVTYIVQTETIAVSKRQMSRFRKLYAFDGKPMMNNSRPVQKLNNRPVYYFTS